MAALWLRLRRSAVGRGAAGSSARRQNDDEDANNLGARRNSGGGGQGGEGREDAGKCSRGASDDWFGLDGAVDLLRVGAGIFRERDPDGSGNVSPDVFREVKRLSGINWQGSGVDWELCHVGL